MLQIILQAGDAAAAPGARDFGSFTTMVIVFMLGYAFGKRGK